MNVLRLTTLTSNLALFVGIVLLVNGLIFGLGVQSPGDGGTGGGPPGWLVGSVWVLLFAAFGASHWLLREEGPAFMRARFGVEALTVLCAAYPLYTIGLSNRQIGLAGNIVTGLAAVGLAWRVWPLSPRAAGLIMPVVPWLTFASWTLMRTMGR